MTRVLCVALGGAAGAVARYLVGGWAAARWGTAFPIGTLLVNATGSLLLGLVAALTTDRFVAPQARLLLGVGFLGAYTTFSTLAYETLALLAGGSFVRAALNAVGSLIIGLLAAWVGSVIGRLL
ncbi:MAG: fluoride efflux transporter CrcB [Armatimonadetes bacterium]|nr:fluoride efflux transporter CrcB [Armatimonadota bacterium]